MADQSVDEQIIDYKAAERRRLARESAFPVPAGNFSGGESWGSDPGMTLRDYFAAAALPAVYAQHVAVGGDMQDSIAEECYELADAMIAAKAGQ